MSGELRLVRDFVIPNHITVLVLRRMPSLFGVPEFTRDVTELNSVTSEALNWSRTFLLACLDLMTQSVEEAFPRRSVGARGIAISA